MEAMQYPHSSKNGGNPHFLLKNAYFLSILVVSDCGKNVTLLPILPVLTGIQDSADFDRNPPFGGILTEF